MSFLFDIVINESIYLWTSGKQSKKSVPCDAILVTLISFCVNEHWFQLFFFFALSDVCYINACTLEEKNSHLCRISTYSAPTYSIHLIITGTAPKGTYNTAVSKQETFLSPHNSRTIISLDPSSSLPTDDTATSRFPHPFSCFFFHLFTGFSFLHPPCRHLSTFAFSFSLLSLHSFLR